MIYFYTEEPFGQIKENDVHNHSTMKGGGSKLCGKKNQPPCPVPLNSYILYIIIIALLLGYKYLHIRKNKNKI